MAHLQNPAQDASIRVSNVPAISGGREPCALMQTDTIKTHGDFLEALHIPLVTSEELAAKKQKRGDEGYLPFAERTSMPGCTTSIAVYHMYDRTKPAIHIDVPLEWVQYQIRPTYLGLHKKQRIIYLNAQDPEFYKQKLPQPKKTVWLLIKNVTFSSGGYVKRRLVEEMLRQNIQPMLMNPNRFDLTVTTDGLGTVVYANQPVKLPDAVIPRVGANVDYFGLAVMRHLQALGVLVFNPVQSIEISRDKLFTHQVLSAAHIPIPRSLLSRFPIDVELVERTFGYPVICKLASGSKGDAVWKVDNRQELQDIDKVVDHTKPLIFQDFLATTKGRDLRCFVIGDRVVGAMMRIAASGFKANVHQGGSVKVVQVHEPLEKLAALTAKLCHLDFSGVDLLIDKDTYRICEVNSSPGFEGLERACEIDVAKETIDFVMAGIEKRELSRTANPTKAPPMIVPVDPVLFHQGVINTSH